MSAGRHGLIAERTDGVVRMTVRPIVRALTAEDMAMIIGNVLDVSDGYNDDLSRADTIQRIWDWEHGTFPIKLTQKKILAYCTDAWYLANYEQGCTSMFDGDVESHQVLLELIHDRFPKFKQIEAECEEE